MWLGHRIFIPGKPVQVRQESIKQFIEKNKIILKDLLIKITQLITQTIL